MPWGFTTLGSMGCNLLIALGVLWGIGSAFFNSVRLLFYKRRFETRALLRLFAFLGVLCVFSVVSYLDGLRESLGLDRSISASFQHLPANTAGVTDTSKAFRGRGNYMYPSIDNLNSRIDRVRINICVILMAIFLSLVLVLRKFFHKKEESSFDALITVFGIAGVIVTGTYLLL